MLKGTIVIEDYTINEWTARRTTPMTQAVPELVTYACTFGERDRETGRWQAVDFDLNIVPGGEATGLTRAIFNQGGQALTDARRAGTV